MKNVIVRDHLYRVTDANFRRFLRAIEASHEMPVVFLGPSLGPIINATELTAQTATEILKSEFYERTGHN